MIVIVKNASLDAYQIADLNGFSIPPQEEIDLGKEFPLYRIAESADLIKAIATQALVVNDGVQDLTVTDATRYVAQHGIIQGPKDRSGKLRVHQTSRKFGTIICWSGTGDNPADVHHVWGGESTSIVHKIGDTEPLVKYIDLNCVNNETWLHEGYLTWNNCQLDTLSFEMVPRVTATLPGAGTNYRKYGPLIIPAAGNGDTELQVDIHDPQNGLVFVPDNDLGERPTAFWDADYNPATKLYENIAPNAYGQGRYNMFHVELPFARFVNEIPLLANGFIALNSSDTDQLGHGMRLKIIGDTNNNVDDHEWEVAFILCMHRANITPTG